MQVFKACQLWHFYLTRFVPVKYLCVFWLQGSSYLASGPTTVNLNTFQYTYVHMYLLTYVCIIRIILLCIHFSCILHFYTDSPQTAPMIIICRETGITSGSFIVRWDMVNDIFPVNYTVRWYQGDSLIGMVSVDGLSYTVTGLTANTSYIVTVAAINTCCGIGPNSNVIIATANNIHPTLSPTVTTTITITRATTSTAIPTLGNITFCKN